MSESVRKDFAFGIDSNYMLDMRRGRYDRKMGENVRLEEKPHQWFYHGQPIDNLYQFFAERRARLFRVRLWTGNDGHSGLNYATETARLAYESGLQPFLVVFLSETWHKEDVPEQWKGLSQPKLMKEIARYSEGVARHFKDAGIPIDTYVIGNETEYGICRPESDNHKAFVRAADPSEWRAFGLGGVVSRKVSAQLRKMTADIWSFQAEAMKAVASGVRSVDPEARFGAHMMSYWEPNMAIGFFGALIEGGAPADVHCLSYYPGLAGDLSVDRMKETVALLYAKYRRPILLTECGYASEKNTGMFRFLNTAITGYPMTPRGQAKWAKDFLAWGLQDPRIGGIIFWSPELYPGDVWQPQAFFDSQGQAKPVVDAVAEFGAKLHM